MNHYDVAIIGGGPGGLACAEILARHGARTILLERKKNIGAKVCAGGITWQGLIQRVPRELIQRTFPEQHIYSNWQRICFKRPEPVIATVNREELGAWMRDKAVNSGSIVRTGCYVKSVSADSLTATDEKGKTFSLRYDHLVGADGSTSLVRRSLGIPATRLGIGINYQLYGHYDRMEWHLNTSRFGSGYGWIFPHRDTISIGAYAPCGTINPDRLKHNLIAWAEERGFTMAATPARAEFINYDYRGFQFGRTWLVGDAAGLASGLTGEGINPAILSGEEIARKIIAPDYQPESITAMTRKLARHARISALSSRSRPLCTFLMESLVLMLRLKIMDFQKELSL